VLPDLQMGGGQQVVLRTIQHMDAARFRHHVCYFHPHHDLLPRFRQAGIEPVYLAHCRGLASRHTLRRVIRLVRDNGVNLVHVQGTPVDKLYGQLAALCCGLPVVRTLHGPRFRPGALRAILRNGVLDLLDYVLEPLTARHYIAVSAAVGDSWQPYLNWRGLYGNNMTVIPNGVPVLNGQTDRTAAYSLALRGELGLNEADPILINVGRLDARKGQRFLIPVMATVLRQHPDAALLLVGDGPMHGDLEQAAAAAGVEPHIRLLGARHDVPALLSLADILVFPSLGEGMPLAVLEAMAAGLPVLAFDLPGLDKLVRDGVTGKLVADHTVAAFSQSLLDLLADCSSLHSMGRNARALIREQYDIEECVDRVERIYLAVLKRHERNRLFRRCVPSRG